MDYNNLQAYGRPTEICAFEPVAAKWGAFGWQVVTVDGHDHGALLTALEGRGEGKPRLIIARTVKGKGVSFMEDQLIWHYYIVTDEHRDRALAEIG
jgi:transketolase